MCRKVARRICIPNSPRLAPLLAQKPVVTVNMEKLTHDESRIFLG
jgi:hypothetical protein